MSVRDSVRSGGIKGVYIFDFLQHKGMLCVFSRIASNEYIQYTISI